MTNATQKRHFHSFFVYLTVLKYSNQTSVYTAQWVYITCSRMKQHKTSKIEILM